MHQTSSPLWLSEHDAPSWYCDSLFSIDSLFDFVEFLLDPIIYVIVSLRRGFCRNVTYHCDRHSEAFSTHEELHHLYPLQSNDEDFQVQRTFQGSESKLVSSTSSIMVGILQYREQPGKREGISIGAKCDLQNDGNHNQSKLRR